MTSPKPKRAELVKAERKAHARWAALVEKDLKHVEAWSKIKYAREAARLEWKKAKERLDAEQ